MIDPASTGAIHSSLPPHVRETVLTVGTFDGVHRGHLDVLTRLAARGRASDRTSVLVTFEPHPLELLKPEAAPALLTTRSEKLAAICTTGIDLVVMLPFTRALAEHSAEQFVDHVLRARFRMAALMIGHDHGFGRGRAGDIETLRLLGHARGFSVDVVAPIETDDGMPVSSTRIRRALAAGDLATAAAGLGRRYALTGRVVPGEQRGRALGYRTLNIEPESTRKLLPPDGVYAVEVDTLQGVFGGMLNLGGRPTFDDDRRVIEAHLFDAAGDFYDDVVQVRFVARLRDTMRFDGAAALVAQLGQDERDARLALTLSSEPGNLSGSTQFPPSTP